MHLCSNQSGSFGDTPQDYRLSCSMHGVSVLPKSKLSVTFLRTQDLQYMLIKIFGVSQLFRESTGPDVEPLKCFSYEEGLSDAQYFAMGLKRKKPRSPNAQVLYFNRQPFWCL